MNGIRRIFLSVAAAWLLAGCSTTITNLTPSQLPRSDSSLYMLEAQWARNAQMVVDGSVNPKVVIGLEQYPMKPTLQVEDRWETVVPIPRDTKEINYYYKFDYHSKGFGRRRFNSVASDPHTLLIVDPE